MCASAASCWCLRHRRNNVISRPKLYLRNRLIYASLAGLVLVLGLLSRSAFATVLPSVISDYAGDTLWAMEVYFVLAFLLPRSSWLVRLALAAALCLGVELSQLYHEPWIDRIRRTRLGGLLLGYGFLWSDLLCYACGITVAAVCDQWLRRRAAGSDSPPLG